MHFEEIIKKEAPEMLGEINSILIPDACVATFQIEKGKAAWIKNNITKRGSSDDGASFDYEEINSNDFPKFRETIIVLTSPYTDEIQNQGVKGPAIGKTGRVISKYFLYHLWSYLNASFLDGSEIDERSLVDEFVGKYKLFLINPIQYQTKYGDRDTLFNKLFGNEEIKDDFKSRLQKRKPYLLINACAENSQDEVGMVIQDVFKGTGFHYLIANHPSSGNCWSPFWER